MKFQSRSLEIPKLRVKLMINRHIKNVVDYSLKHFPCVILTGPRQVGKTTLLSEEYVKIRLFLCNVR